MEQLEPTIEQFDENGELTVKELAKEYLTKGSWQTLLFLYQEKDAKTGDFGEPKVAIRRFQKSAGQLKLRSKFNISSKAQAMQIVDLLKRWYPEA